MRNCSVKNCPNKKYISKTESKTIKKKDSFILFSFPKDTKLKDEWLKALKWEDWKFSNNSRVCSAHFEEKYLYRNNNNIIGRLKPDAVPSIFESFTKKMLNEVSNMEITNDPIDIEDNETIIPRLDIEFVDTSKIESFNHLENKVVLSEATSTNENIVSNSDNETDYELSDLDNDQSFSTSFKERITLKRALEASSLIDNNLIDKHSSSKASVIHLNNCLKFLTNKVHKQLAQIKILNQNNIRKYKKIKQNKEIIKLRNNDDFKLLLNEPSCSLQNYIMLKQIAKLKKNKEKGKWRMPNTFPDIVKSFAMKLYSYSFEAYHFVWESFNFCLPHPQKIIEWNVTANDNSHSITEEKKDFLEEKQEEEGEVEEEEEKEDYIEDDFIEEEYIDEDYIEEVN